MSGKACLISIVHHSGSLPLFRDQCLTILELGWRSLTWHVVVGWWALTEASNVLEVPQQISSWLHVLAQDAHLSSRSVSCIRMQGGDTCKR